MHPIDPTRAAPEAPTAPPPGHIARAEFDSMCDHVDRARRDRDLVAKDLEEASKHLSLATARAAALEHELERREAAHSQAMQAKDSEHAAVVAKLQAQVAALTPRVPSAPSRAAPPKPAAPTSPATDGRVRLTREPVPGRATRAALEAMRISREYEALGFRETATDRAMRGIIGAQESARRMAELQKMLEVPRYIAEEQQRMREFDRMLQVSRELESERQMLRDIERERELMLQAASGRAIAAHANPFGRTKTPFDPTSLS